MKQIVGLLLVITTLPAFAQIRWQKIDRTTIPVSIQFKGNLVGAYRWQDRAGDHLVMLSLSEPVSTPSAPDDGYRDQALYAYHYFVEKDSTRQTWRVYDYVKECPVDVILGFNRNTFAVTDLDNNGIGEVWVMYKVSCQGDVSPVPMKIIMYEGNQKYAMRGTTRVRVSEKEFMGGDFNFDQAFGKGPAVFREYAEKLWNKYKIETWGE